MSDYTYRHFKIVNLNGKDVNFDYSAKIKEKQTPLNAAKKLLKSICLHMGLKGMKKLQCNATFIIKETTQGSKKKEFGPYKGSYIKYTPAEAKKAMASGISFKMKPYVKLSKKMFPKNKSSMKGGNEVINYNIQVTCPYCKKWARNTYRGFKCVEIPGKYFGKTKICTCANPKCGKSFNPALY